MDRFPTPRPPIPSSLSCLGVALRLIQITVKAARTISPTCWSRHAGTRAHTPCHAANRWLPDGSRSVRPTDRGRRWRACLVRSWRHGRATRLLVVGLLVGLLGRRIWRAERQAVRDQQLDARVQAAGMDLGHARVERQVQAAVILRLFLQPGYERVYGIIFDLAVTNLRMHRWLRPSGGAAHGREDTTQALAHPLVFSLLVDVFKEAVPRARDRAGGTLHAADVYLATAHLRQADLAHLTMPNADLGDADLTGATLMGANLRGANLQRANLTGANLRDADLTAADLTGATLFQADLTRATLRGATLTRAFLFGADLTQVNLMAADLTQVNLADATLAQATVAGATLDQAFLVRANLTGANLRGANLRDADLSDADLRDADLTAARLTRAVVRPDQLAHTRSLDGAILP